MRGTGAGVKLSGTYATGQKRFAESLAWLCTLGLLWALAAPKRRRGTGLDDLKEPDPEDLQTL